MRILSVEVTGQITSVILKRSSYTVFLGLSSKIVRQLTCDIGMKQEVRIKIVSLGVSRTAVFH